MISFTLKRRHGKGRSCGACLFADAEQPREKLLQELKRLTHSEGGGGLIQGTGEGWFFHWKRDPLVTDSEGR